MAQIKLDSYTIQARIVPALIVLAPLSLTVMGLMHDQLDIVKMLWTIVGSFGAGLLLSQFVRDVGVRKQPKLFETWGGPPTTTMLRLGSSSLNPLTLERYRKYIGNILPGVSLPTLSAEESDPEDADRIYESVTMMIRERTRDEKDFPLVFSENVSYGFRRNLWALKPIGLSISLLFFTGSYLLFVFDYTNTHTFSATLGIVAGMNFLLAVTWLVGIKPQWVRVAADRYAERLLGSCEILSLKEKQ